MILIDGVSSPGLKTKLDNLSFYLLVYVAVTLPFGIAMNGVGIILFAVSVLARQGIIGIYSQLNATNYLSIGFYLLYVIGMLYTENIGAGGFDLEKKLSLIVFPIFLGAVKLSKRQLSFLLLWFVIACGCLTLYMLLNAGLKYYLFDTSTYLFSGRLSQPGGAIHRAYFAMYLLFGIVSCIYLAQKEWPKCAVLFVFVILIFSVSIFLLSARMCFIVYILLFIRHLWNFMFIKRNYRIGSLALLIFLLSIVSIVRNPMMIDKLEQLYKDLDRGNTKRNSSSVNLRIIKWKCTLTLFTQNPLVGVGTGDVSDKLVGEYKRINFYWGIKDRYNAHNQYLETALALGSIGLIVLVLIFMLPFVKAVKNENTLYAEFIFIFAFCCLAESMFNAQKGVVFYSLFNGVFLSTSTWSNHKKRAS